MKEYNTILRASNLLLELFACINICVKTKKSMFFLSRL